MIFEEPIDSVRLALIDRLADSELTDSVSDESIDALIRLLADPAWPIRSAAATALIHLGPRILPDVERFARSAGPEAALAAARIKAIVADRAEDDGLANP